MDIALKQKDAEELQKKITALVSCEDWIMGSGEELSILKVQLSMARYSIGEKYTIAQMTCNSKWLAIKQKDKTVAETDRELGATEEYRRMRDLKQKLKSIDRMLASIRDRLEVLKKGAEHLYDQ